MRKKKERERLKKSKEKSRKGNYVFCKHIDLFLNVRIIHGDTK